MQNKMVAIGVLVVGASALGAGIWIASGGNEPAKADSRLALGTEQSVAPPVIRDFSETIDEPGIEVPERARGGFGGGSGDIAAMIEERMKEFDLDGDGVMSPEEMKAMRAAMRERFRGGMDREAEGEMSFEERVIARRERMLNSPRGDRIAARFDADGDGVLSEEEIAAMDASIAEREQSRIDRDLERYDADGDGQLSEAEKEDRRVDRDTRQEERMQKFTQEFDDDGDGGLNEDERVNAITTMMDRRDIDQFLGRYDRNKDKLIGSSEYERFLDSYADEEPFADVNRDGRVDAEDVMAFRDYVERARAVAP